MHALVDFCIMSEAVKVHLSLFTVALIYGANYVIAKGVMPEYLGASGFVFIRIATAAVLFNVVSVLRRSKERIKDKKHYIQMAIAALFGVAANMLLFFHGLAFTSPTNASVLMSNAPVFVLVFSVLVLKDSIRWKQALGIILAGIGAVLLIGGTGFDFNTSNAKGDLMVLVNATSFAFYLVYGKRLLKTYSALFVIRHLFVFGLIYALPFAISDLRSAQFSAFPQEIWIAIVYVAIMTTFVAYLLNAWAVQKATPNLVGSYIYLQPVIATAIAVGLGTQALSHQKVIFALIIFTGVYLVNSNRKKE